MLPSFLAIVSALAVTQPLTSVDPYCDQSPGWFRSPTVASADGKFRVFAEAGAIAFKKLPDGSLVCRFTTSLVLERQGDTRLRRYIIDRREWSNGLLLGFEIYGFVLDRFLLACLVWGGGDAAFAEPVLLDLATGRMERIDLLARYGARKWDSCPVDLIPHGLESPNRLVIYMRMSGANYLAPGEKPCVKDGYWSLDLRSGQWTRRPDNKVLPFTGAVTEPPKQP